ncbi:MAG: FG-GAP-like repeat-containing protein [Bacteroidia bacterium]|nr:FG-GAP-like repeat-containing protein [Bacteroidia bacterium]
MPQSEQTLSATANGTAAFTPGAYSGVTASSFDVNSNGMALYSIPIDVPPGTAQMMPSLTLAYQSLVQNGYTGTGWQLMGLGMISRTGNTMANDGFFSGITMTSADQYELDGQRLIRVSGTATSDSAVFRTNIESWSQVTAYNGCGSGYCRFKVQMRNGLVREFSRGIPIRGSNTKRGWALTKITDLNGNAMQIDYTADSLNSNLYPLQISYTINNGLNTLRYVRFSYESRPDTTSQYVGGVRTSWLNRLSLISTYVGTQFVNQYKLTYSQSAATGKSILERVMQCDAAGRCLPPISCAWQANTSGGLWQAMQQVSVQTVPQTAQNLPMDVNGDGYTDVVQAWQGSGSSQQNKLMLAIYLSNGSTLGTASIQNTQLNQYSSPSGLRSMDVNGDGMIDLVLFSNASNSKLAYTVLLSNGTNFSAQTTTTTSISCYSTPSGIVPLDINGDGRSDAVYPSQATGNKLQYSVLLSTGTTFSAQPTVATRIVSYSSTPVLIPAQVNNDPMNDLVYAYPNSQTQRMVLRPLISKGTSLDTTAAAINTTSSSNLARVLPGDFNGDHLTDIALTSVSDSVRILLYNSTGLNYVAGGRGPAYSKSQMGTLMPGDVNGDGRTDMVYSYADSQQKQRVVSLVSSGYSLQQQAQLPLANANWLQFGIITADLNGDAKTDVVNFAPSGNSQQQPYTLLANGIFPDLANFFNNGIGGNVQVTYLPLTNPSVYSKTINNNMQVSVNRLVNQSGGGATPAGSSSSSGNGVYGASFPVVQEVLPMHVVSGYTQSDGYGGSYPFSFKYASALYDFSGYGWLGPAQRITTDKSTGAYSTTHYLQQFPFTGKNDTTRIYDLASNALISMLTSEYYSVSTVSNATQVKQVLMRKTRSVSYAANKPATTFGNDYQYDTYGNVSWMKETGTKITYTKQQFQNNAQKWIFGLPVLQVVSSDSGSTQMITQNKYAYFPQNNELKSESRWVQSNDWVTQRYSYDRYGNRTAVKIFGDSTVMMYDDTFKTFVKTIIQPANVSGRRLTSSFTYDMRNGQQTSITNANGKVTRMQYDAFGRNIFTFGPDSTGAMDTLSKTTYTTNGNIGYITNTQVLITWKGLWKTVSNYQDGLGRLVRVASGGTGSGLFTNTEMVLDSKGRTIKESTPYFSGSSTTKPRWTTRVYNSADQLTRLVVPAGNTDSSVTLYTYNGILHTEVLQAAGTRDSSRVKMDYAWIQNQPLISSYTDATRHVTTYSYDVTGRVTGSSDPLSQQSVITYNGLGQRLTYKDPTLGTTTYTYNDSLRTIMQQYSNGKTLTNKLDALGRRIQSSTSDGNVVSYTYDDASVPNGLSNLTKVTMNNGFTYNYAYDNYNNVNYIQLKDNNTTYTSLQTYTPNHQPSVFTYPDGSTITYGYNSNGDMQKIVLYDAVSATTSTAASYSGYNPFGKPGTYSFGNGTSEKYSWSSSGFLQRHIVNAANGSVLLNDSLTWTKTFNVSQIIGQQTTQSRSFGYDAAGRVLSANVGGSSTSFTYDGGGNMLTGNQLRYINSGNKMMYGLNGTDTVLKMTYDAVGNMIKRKNGSVEQEYTYQYGNYLTEIKQNGTQQLQFKYDANGNRLSQTNVQTGAYTLYVSPNYTIYYTNSSRTSGLVSKTISGPNGIVCTVSQDISAAAPKQKAHEKRMQSWMHLQQNNTGLNNFLYYCGEIWENATVRSSVAWALLLLVNLWFIIHFIRSTRRRRKSGEAYSFFSVQYVSHLLRPLAPALFFAFSFYASSFAQDKSSVFAQVFSGPTIASVASPGSLFFHQDQVTSTSITTGGTGALSAQVTYSAFGQVMLISGQDNFTNKFTGRQYDYNSGLYYYNARYYDPLLCRFITPDSQLGSELTSADVMNRYAYLANNPQNSIDPTGHSFFSWFTSLVIDVLEIAAGIAIGILSDGALSMVSETLIGAGINGLIYTATHYDDFSWKDFGIQQAVGAAMGFATAGAGALFEAGSAAIRAEAEAAEVIGEEAGESSAARLCMRETGENEAMEIAEFEGEGISAQQAQCFAAGTTVATPTGTQKIELLRSGDMVLSTAEDGTVQQQRVTRTFTREQVQEVIVVTTSGQLHTTGEHPFWTARAGWCTASALRPGDVLRTNTSQTVLVSYVYTTGRTHTVYNIEVENGHTYFVGADGVLVHNVCYTPSGNAYDVEVKISRSRWPESADHIEDAQNAGHPEVLTIDRSGARMNRRQSLAGWKTISGFDRDEYPPAMFWEGGSGASIRYIAQWDNRGSGSYFGSFLRYSNNGGIWPDGSRVWFNVVP